MVRWIVPKVRGGPQGSQAAGQDGEGEKGAASGPTKSQTASDWPRIGNAGPSLGSRCRAYGKEARRCGGEGGVMETHRAMYGGVNIPRAFCQQCEAWSFVLDGQRACCGVPRNPPVKAPQSVGEMGRARCSCCDQWYPHAQMCLDHDHTTGERRGWVCHGCNVSIGYFEKGKGKRRHPARTRMIEQYLAGKSVTSKTPMRN